jgi:amidophosphoribosyltransferase
MSGLFGVVTKKDDCAETLLYGADYHSHLGTEFGGMAVLGTEFWRQIHNISNSQLKSKFFPEIAQAKGNKGIAVISDSDEQPMYLHSRHGEFCLITNGLLQNTEELAKMLYAKGISFSEMSRGGYNIPEVIAKLITQGDTLIDGIQKMFKIIDGSISLLILSREGIYAARDRYGYTPMVIGKRPDAWAVATETTSFPNNKFAIHKYLEPGEIVLITEDDVIQKVKGAKTCQMCSFYWIYTGFPSSNYENINTEIVRERCGRCLAKQDKGTIECDQVAGVPDSGLAHAIGYAMESGKPFRRPLVKYTPGYGRSYTPPSQRTRDLIATMKLIPIREIIDGSRIVLCEDSIVRGTQLKNYTMEKLWEAGAKEVHVRPACPPLMFPCRFCLSTRSIHELAARKAIHSLEGKDIEDVSEYVDHRTKKYAAMVEWINRDLGATTLKFLTVEDMVASIGLPREKLCTYCWTGQTPVE